MVHRNKCCAALPRPARVTCVSMCARPNVTGTVHEGKRTLQHRYTGGQYPCCARSHYPGETATCALQLTAHYSHEWGNHFEHLTVANVQNLCGVPMCVCVCVVSWACILPQLATLQRRFCTIHYNTKISFTIPVPCCTCLSLAATSPYPGQTPLSQTCYLSNIANILLLQWNLGCRTTLISNKSVPEHKNQLRQDSGNLLLS
jgi:hypothetical protein